MKTIKFKDLSQHHQELLLAAEKATEMAYSPYSHFSIGAAILTKDDQIITGANIENAAYGSGICAERAVMARANAMGQRNFKAVAVIGKGENDDSEKPISPCGLCRQVLHEFSQVSKRDFEVIMSNTKKDKIILATVSELLPLPFNP